MKTPKSVALMGHPDLCILSFNLIESFVETGETANSFLSSTENHSHATSGSVIVPAQCTCGDNKSVDLFKNY